MRTRDRILRAAVKGALAGCLLALAIYGEYRREVATGVSPAGAGLGAGLLSMLASFPLGDLILYGLVLPVLHLIHYENSRTTNMLLFLMFGVVGNWTLMGALLGALPLPSSRRARHHDSPPPVT